MLHLHRLASYRKFSDGSEPALNPQVAREDAMASWARGRVAVARGALMLTACHFESSLQSSTILLTSATRFPVAFSWSSLQ